MKTKILLIALLVISVKSMAQEFSKGTIITCRYDTISDVDIKNVSDFKSLLQITYIDKNGNEQKPAIESIKCYTRGNDTFTRIYNSGEMIMVKKIVAGPKLNLYERNYNGLTIHYIEKVYDELIKVPSSSSKFKKVIGDFLSNSQAVSHQISSENNSDIKELVDLYNKG
ncbi:hypothetical protein [Lutibacter sp.]|uniref:hypothetical protein n=1 Tax=Lutibacter sp. TaxID=1925666 RepID=UPI0027323FC1|nr:hypothetical protein [Lutibacter sp.]MDP3312048.1 hypothetical protein [Lutibacter sp.]